LARQLFTAAASPVTAFADMLRLDDRPIVVSLSLQCGRTAFLLKTAHDESLRKFAPGLILENEILRRFHDTGFADRLDSASVAGYVLDDFFCDRERIGDLVLAVDGTVTPAALRGLVAQDRSLQAARDRLKALYRSVVDMRTRARDRSAVS
jgi:CelD/BcsL family acetyltransferase involved in cellulose biosynthesis